MNQNRVMYIIIGVSLALLVGPKYLKQSKSNSDNKIVKITESVEAEKNTNAIVSEKSDIAMITDEVSDADSSNKLQVLRQKNFAEALKSLGSCLDIKNAASDMVEPTYDNLLSSLQSEFGEAVVNNEDWNNTDIQTASGEIHRINIETDYSGNSSVGRKVRYYRLQEGKPALIPLDKEQSENPSEAFIASLESEGRIVNKERSVRSFFGNGEEATYREKGGQIIELEVSKRFGKKFMCTNLSQEKPHCQCF